MNTNPDAFTKTETAQSREPGGGSKPSPGGFNEWAKVELMGHNVIIGKVSEATMAGGAFLRVDVPSFNGASGFTRFYSPSSIYCISPVSEEVARGLLSHYRHEPVQRFEMPQLAERCEPSDADADDWRLG